MKPINYLTIFLVGALFVGWRQGSAPTLAQEGQNKTFQEYFHALKGKNGPDFTLMSPESDQFVKLEPEGLRITLPPGFDGERKPHGINSGMIVKGDFEFSASFEVLKEPELGKAGAMGTKVHLMATLNVPPRDVFGFTRHQLANSPPRYTAWTNHRRDQVTGKRNMYLKWFEATATKWRFRLVRTGTVLSYHLLEEGQPAERLLDECPFPGDDLKDIRLVAQTGGPEAFMDVRITDFRIRAESLPLLAAAIAEGAEPEAALAPEPASEGSTLRWLAIGLASLVGLGVVLAIWLRRRPRPAEAGTQPSAHRDIRRFACPACRKALQAVARLAGKRVKCHHCGEAVSVPEESEDQASSARDAS